MRHSGAEASALGSQTSLAMAPLHSLTPPGPWPLPWDPAGPMADGVRSWSASASWLHPGMLSNWTLPCSCPLLPAPIKTQSVEATVLGKLLQRGQTLLLTIQQMGRFLSAGLHCSGWVLWLPCIAVECKCKTGGFAAGVSLLLASPHHSTQVRSSLMAPLQQIAMAAILAHLHGMMPMVLSSRRLL